MLNPLFSAKSTQGDVKKRGRTISTVGIPQIKNDSEWGAPYFAQPRQKTSIFLFLSEFSNLKDN